MGLRHIYIWPSIFIKEFHKFFSSSSRFELNQIMIGGGASPTSWNPTLQAKWLIFPEDCSLQLKFRVLDYLPKHPFLKKVCRAKFVDTFVKWQEDFEVEHEVLYHTVKLFDLYLSVTENHLELDYIGASAMIIAAKLDVNFHLCTVLPLFA